MSNQQSLKPVNHKKKIKHNVQYFHPMTTVRQDSQNSVKFDSG